MNKGFLRFDRKLFLLPFWTKPRRYVPAEALLDLLSRACYRHSQVNYNNRIIDLYPDQLVTSVQALAKQWGWSWHHVKAFLAELEAASVLMITYNKPIIILTLHANKIQNPDIPEYVNPATGEIVKSEPDLTDSNLAPEVRHSKNYKKREIEENYSNTFFSPSSSEEPPAPEPEEPSLTPLQLAERKIAEDDAKIPPISPEFRAFCEDFLAKGGSILDVKRAWDKHQAESAPRAA